MSKRSSDQIHVDSKLLDPGDGFPKNSQLPLLVYRQVLAKSSPDAAAEFERLFADNGWRGSWRNGVLSYHHFHSNAHEVLGVCAGSADVQFGKPDGPILSVEAGDVAILPAGTGHKMIKARADFLVVGAYPAGQYLYDTMQGEPAEHDEAEKRIAAVPLPEADPVYGVEGRCWGFGNLSSVSKRWLQC